MAIATFVDSSFLISLLIDQEITHKQSIKLIENNLDYELYLNSLVIYESINVICRKWGIKKANIFKKWIDKHISQGSIKQLIITNDTWDNAYNRLHKSYTKSGPNVFDYIHFACMQEYGIKDVLTFDHHFTSAGFNILK